MVTAVVILAEGAEEIETVTTVDILRRGGVEVSILYLFGLRGTYRVFIKYCVFSSKNSGKFATSPSPALGCYWLYKKWRANRRDCTPALRREL